MLETVANRSATYLQRHVWRTALPGHPVLQDLTWRPRIDESRLNGNVGGSPYSRKNVPNLSHFEVPATSPFVALLSSNSAVLAESLRPWCNGRNAMNGKEVGDR